MQRLRSCPSQPICLPASPRWPQVLSYSTISAAVQRSIPVYGDGLLYFLWAYSKFDLTLLVSKPSALSNLLRGLREWRCFSRCSWWLPAFAFITCTWYRYCWLSLHITHSSLLSASGADQPLSSEPLSPTRTNLYWMIIKPVGWFVRAVRVKIHWAIFLQLRSSLIASKSN